MFFINRQYLTSEPFHACPPSPTSEPQLRPVILSFWGNVIKAGNSTWQVKIWEKSLEDIEAVSIPFTYYCPSVNLALAQIVVSSMDWLFSN